MMTKLMDKMLELAAFELDEANRNNPPFHSAHEGYAVILEEVEELKEAVNGRMIFHKDYLWDMIRHNAPVDDTGKWQRVIELLHEDALNAACEAVQVAAMALKMMDYIEGAGEGEYPQ